MDSKLDLATILDLHAKSLRNELGGVRANLTEADLTRAGLTGANLTGAGLTGAGLTGADLRGANLTRADLTGADLTGADLRGANLSDTLGLELALARVSHLPDGDLIVWKQCQNNVIVKLRIPKEARRSHGSERKCRAEYADVLEVIGGECGVSLYAGASPIVYRAGERVVPGGWDEDRWNTCGQGIHFHLTRIEAENN